MLLAIDTSTALSSIALYEEQVWAERTWTTRRNHSAELLPEVEAMMQRAGLSPRDLTGIAVATGPGSFNGVRVGVTTAKTLAMALSIPIAGISTLKVVAYPHFDGEQAIRPLLDAGRGRFCTAVYEKRGDDWIETEEPRVVAPADLQAAVERPTLFCGDISTKLAAEMRAYWGVMAGVASPARGARRAGYLAEMGWARLRENRGDDPAALQAIYLPRPPLPRVRQDSEVVWPCASEGV
ncbi:MAG: tRNA (adenosine(37)-N6)-threonylcarbamoyltransferase complex dimerization subunit type 1 TsaB [Chloroflexi bacterium]|nr:tRNA (adenosine(37)-N6)-threonylcarbamoyltransferase complex dimerization subunit type 1 TsaB [Chloroflexota bacterium]MCL5026581.1 tRNA (adenosine(37)-N6)-threonylcarbamoyltransferase complex dimerization subunit type 1 TsaB [Chloroflexota bacterium]